MLAGPRDFASLRFSVEVERRRRVRGDLVLRFTVNSNGERYGG